MGKRHLKAAAKKVRAHGIGVHKPEEIEEFGRNDLKVLSDLLADKPFFFGDAPTQLDVVAFANLAQVAFMDKEVSYALRDWMVENCANLVDFCNRVKDRAFPDWSEMCENLDLNSHLPKPPPKEEEKKEETKEEVKKEETKEEEKKKRLRKKKRRMRRKKTVKRKRQQRMRKRERKKTIRPQKRRKKSKDGSHCCSQTKYTCIICDKCCLKGFLLTLCIVLVSVEHKRIQQATNMLVQVLM